MTSVPTQQQKPLQNPSSAAQSVAPVSAPSSSSGTLSQRAAAGRSFGNTHKGQTTGPHAESAAHGKTDSISPANGKGPVLPAVPSLGGPIIVNGNNAVSPISHQFEHSRKPSVTISAAGASGQMPNGGPVAGTSAMGNGIPVQFGSINAGASPNLTNSNPHAGANPSTLAVASSPNPRISSPQTSPSPIPQPAASGGRPPSSFHTQGNGLPSFGSLGDDSNRQSRASMSGMSSGSLTPGLQSSQLRRESSQQSNSDMANGSMSMNFGRGGYHQQAGRGRCHPQQMSQSMPYSPNTAYRSVPSAPRSAQGMPSPFMNQGNRPIGPYPHSPGPGRSPALAHTQPVHPHGQHPLQSPAMQQPHYAGYPPHMMPPQTQHMQFYDGGYQYYAAPYSMPQHMPMQPYNPASPRPSFGGQPGQLPYAPGPYSQPQPISRTPSGVGEPPPSTAGQSQTPMTPAVSLQSQPPQQQPQQTRAVSSPGPKSTDFRIPKKKGGIVIKDPTSGLVKTFDKAPESPALAAPSKSPVTVSSASTPPPRTPSRTESHTRTESKLAQSNSEMVRKLKEDIANKLAADKAEEERARQEAEAKDKRNKEDVEPERPEEDKVSEDSAAVGEAGATVEAKAPEAEIARIDDTTSAIAEKVEGLESESQPEDKPAEPAAAPKTESEEPAEPELHEDSDEYWERYEAEERRREEEREAQFQAKKKAKDEEKARQEAEAAAKLDEELKEAERDAEAREEERLKRLEANESETKDVKNKKDLFASLKKSDNAFKATESASSDTPASGAATPTSDASSMPPPAPRATGQAKQKPNPLKLKMTEQVEPPQPSAALQSLRSARFLQKIDDALYPSAIASPNPALNSAAPMGKFRYDKNFLMQFQNVFTEKPSETWSDRVKETVGDTSETPGSARPRGPNSTMPPRSASRVSVMSNNPFQSSGMGSFAAAQRTLPPGTTSEGRFAASNREPSKGGSGGLRYNPSVSGSFGLPFSQSMQRTPSSTSMGHPQSPRNNPSHKGSQRGSKAGRRDVDKEAQKMPLTAGQDLKPIEVSAGGWKPHSVKASTIAAGPPPGGDGYLAPDVVQRKVKSALNKMTPTTFDKISGQILDIVMQSKKETDGRTLRQVIQLTFEKATDESHWAQMYAEFCSRMLHNMTADIKDETLALDKNGKVNAGSTLFRKYLLNRCQQDFEAGWKSKLPDKPEGDSQEAAMLSDEYYTAAAAKRRGLGLVKFIGELYKLGMLTSRIMHMCMHRLLDYEGIPDEAEVESLTSLLKTIGDSLDTEEKSRSSMDAYFQRISDMMKLEALPSRLKFMLMDIVDLRRKGWKVKEASKGPATLEEIHAQAAAVERQKEAQRIADASKRGGGRMPMGRGDIRQMPGNPMMPPPQQNSVGMDDLRRLGRGPSRQPSSQGPVSFGPPSVFATRGSNTRRTLGVLGRGGEDSGSSSRTATPPVQVQKKEDKESSSRTNTFSSTPAIQVSIE